MLSVAPSMSEQVPRIPAVAAPLPLVRERRSRDAGPGPGVSGQHLAGDGRAADRRGDRVRRSSRSRGSRSTAAVAAEVDVSLPASLVAVTTTRMEEPTSSGSTRRYVLSVAPGMSEQFPRSALSLHRRHWYVSVGAGTPVQVPGALGGQRLAGDGRAADRRGDRVRRSRRSSRSAATTAVAAEVDDVAARVVGGGDDHAKIGADVVGVDEVIRAVGRTGDVGAVPGIRVVAAPSATGT